MPRFTAVCHESGYLLSPLSHLHAFQWLPLPIDSLLPLTHQPASFFIIITFFHNSWYFLRGDLNSIIISFFSLNFLPILLGFLFASFINVAQVILKVLPSIHKFLNSYLLLFLLCHSMYPFLCLYFLLRFPLFFFSSSSHYRWKFPAHKFSTFFFFLNQKSLQILL